MFGSIGRFIRWALWDWWHGESVGHMEVTRTTSMDAPAVEIGSLSLSKGAILKVLLVILLLALLGGVVYGLTKIGISLPTLVPNEASLPTPTQQGLRVVNACVIMDESNGRTFMATDCMFSNAWCFVTTYWYLILVLVVMLVLAFLAGYWCRGKRDNRDINE